MQSSNNSANNRLPSDANGSNETNPLPSEMNAPPPYDGPEIIDQAQPGHFQVTIVEWVPQQPEVERHETAPARPSSIFDRLGQEATHYSRRPAGQSLAAPSVLRVGLRHYYSSSRGGASAVWLGLDPGT